MAKITPYFLFNGNCREAMEFYGRVFKTEPSFETFAEAKNENDPALNSETKNLISHGEIKIGTETIMFADVPPAYNYNFGNNLVTAFRSSSLEEIKEVFSLLKDGGNVTMELQKTPWSECYGSVTDKFGLSWNLNHDITL
jgi:PhnB protein